MSLALWLALIVLTFALATGVVALLRHLARGGRARALALCGESAVLVEDSALFLGRQSIGPLQQRGNGCLALGAEALVFVQWVPTRVLEVALADLRVVDHPRSHLGKSLGRPLLRVSFRDGAAEDSAAWCVRDPEAWARALAGARDAAKKAPGVALGREG